MEVWLLEELGEAHSVFSDLEKAKQYAEADWNIPQDEWEGDDDWFRSYGGTYVLRRLTVDIHVPPNPGH